MSSKASRCTSCQKDLGNDYYIFNIVRIKDNIPHYAPNPIQVCSSCYDVFYKLQEESKQLIKDNYDFS